MPSCEAVRLSGSQIARAKSLVRGWGYTREIGLEETFRGEWYGDLAMRRVLWLVPSPWAGVLSAHFAAAPELRGRALDADWIALLRGIARALGARQVLAPLMADALPGVRVVALCRYLRSLGFEKNDRFGVYLEV